MKVAQLNGSPGSSAAAAGPAAAVTVDAVTKHYGRVTAVRHLDLTVPPGEFLTLLGPSGCGKTTTLRLIAGFEHPDAGAIMLNGRDVSRMPPYRRRVNTVFQQYALFPHLSVRDNIGYGLRHRGAGKRDTAGRVTRMMQLMQIPDVGGRRPRELSGGQQQRVALARALVMEPTVLLLDEPLGSLDYKLRKDMQAELKRIHREVGVTFIYVTHDQEEAMTMSDRIVVMNGGRVEQDGSPEDVFDRPATPFVAGFIGDTNLLDGTVTAVGEGTATVDLGPLGQLAGSAVGSAAPGDPVTVSIRPTDVRAEPAPAGQDGPIVRDAVLVGGHVAVTVAVGAATVRAHVPRNAAVPPGTAVQMRVDPGRVRVFRKETL